MNNSDISLYKSMPTGRSIGNEYSIYTNRIELKSIFPFLTKTFVIHRDDLISIDTYRPPVIRTSFLALKLDLADIYEHVWIKRRNGLFKQLRFTPENPKEFVIKAKEIPGLGC